MRDNMLVNVSGLEGHTMGIDLNLEHLIGQLKVTFYKSSENIFHIQLPRICLRLKGFSQHGTGWAIFQLPSTT